MKTRSYHQIARAESAEATGRRIADAFLALLMKEWFDEITLDQVAEDAGVTVQTVVRRFGGKEGLLEIAVAIFGDQVKTPRAAPPGDLDRIVSNLLADYERTGDAVIRMLALEGRHAAIEPALKLGRTEHRGWVSAAFAEELRKFDPPACQRALDALVIATDVYTWKLLRRDMRRSAQETARAIKNLIHAITTSKQP